MAVDYRRDGIRVNCVCTGPAETAMIAGMLDNLGGNPPLGLPQRRMATNNEVAALIEFLVSPQANYFSGAIIPVNGSLTVHGAGMPFLKRRS